MDLSKCFPERKLLNNQKYVTLWFVQCPFLPSLPFCTLTCIRYADVHYIQMSRFGCPNLVSKYSCCVGPGRWDSETLLHLLKINPVLLIMFAQNY